MTAFGQRPGVGNCGQDCWGDSESSQLRLRHSFCPRWTTTEYGEMNWGDRRQRGQPRDHEKAARADAEGGSRRKVRPGVAPATEQRIEAGDAAARGTWTRGDLKEGCT